MVESGVCVVMVVMLGACVVVVVMPDVCVVVVVVMPGVCVVVVVADTFYCCPSVLEWSQDSIPEQVSLGQETSSNAVRRTSETFRIFNTTV